VQFVVLAAALVVAQAGTVALAVHDGQSEQVIARRGEAGWVAAEMRRCVSAGGPQTVTAGALQVDAPRLVMRAAPEWPSLEAAILSTFDQREREHRLTSSNLSDVAPTIDWVYAHADAGATVYYFEVSRRIPDPGTAPEDDPKGTLRIAASGWLRGDDSGRLASIGSKGELRWEQDDVAPATPRPDLRPLGVIRDGRARVWVMHGQTGAAARYTLYDVSPDAISTRAAVQAAVCR
jgi:hypothetical protein